MLQLLLDQKYPSPTPIQSACWPCILQGRDVIGLAKTGSGKTLGYLLPSIVHMNAQPLPASGEGPIVLILAPTRELAEQIQQEFKKFGDPLQITSAALYGGVARSEQIRELARLTQFVVATPGRLIDFVLSRKIHLGRVTYLVLDEADKMLEMGFAPQIRAIVSQLRPDRQTLLFSATWPPEVEQLGAQMLRNPLRIDIGTRTVRAAENIVQSFEFCDEGEKSKWFFMFIERSVAALKKRAEEEEEEEKERKEKEKQRNPHKCTGDIKKQQQHRNSLKTFEEDEENSSYSENPHHSPSSSSSSLSSSSPRILVFCSTKQEANELFSLWPLRNISVRVIHGDKKQDERAHVLSLFRSGACAVLIATDVAARGLDVPDIHFVVNYSFPGCV